MKPWLLKLLVTVIGSTLRFRIDDAAGLLDNTPHQPLIFTFWHNRIFLMPHLFRKFWMPRGHHNVAVLVSRSKDGQFLSDILASFKLRCVRGSSSRGGKEALLELTRLVQDGFDVGITPDGPRGPRYILQPGCIALAQLTGAPIVPLSYDVTNKITLKSWDAFMIPLPFSRCTVTVGKPLTVPRDADENVQEEKRVELENQLRGMTERRAR